MEPTVEPCPLSIPKIWTRRTSSFGVSKPNFHFRILNTRRSFAFSAAAPPRKAELEYWRPSEYFVNITCSAFDISPKPIFGFYLTDTENRRCVCVKIKSILIFFKIYIYLFSCCGRRHAIAIHGRTDERTFKKAHYTSHSWGLVVYAATRSESRIGCSIFIPGTAYYETREKIYYPGNYQTFPILRRRMLSAAPS